MRTVLATILIILACSATVAYGGGRNTAKAMAQFANEVAAKVLYRKDVNVAVRADNCNLHIEYGKLNVAFDLPLSGTTLEETDTEDGIILSNAQMTRTLKDKTPETYSQLILRFERKDIKSIRKTFEDAVGICTHDGAKVAGGA